MKTTSTLLTVLACTLCISSMIAADSTGFQKVNITDGISLIGSEDEGEAQVIIESQKGLVVLNSSLSQSQSGRFREAIKELTGRNDFLYLINIIDRLDRCGGNATYTDIPTIGHKAFLDRFQNKKAAVDAEVADMVEMWRWKERVARERLPNHEPGSARAIGAQRWINICNKRAEDLESGFSLVLPTELYEDRKTIDLGDITLELIWFGRGHRDAMTVVRIPEVKMAIIPDDALSPLHLAPHPSAEYKELDVPRWIQVLEELLEGENAVDSVLLADFLNVVWSRERTHIHLDYIRRLWNGVREADAQGKSLNEVYEQFSLDNEFSFVKDFPVYQDRGDEWVRPQHQGHIKLFYLQGKNVATAIIREAGPESLSDAIAEIRRQWQSGADIFIEEAELNRIGYGLLNQEKFADAIAVFRLNVDVYPESANVYDSYAEALMKSGQTESAILNYKKSLALNPENNNAREMLQVLENQ